MAIEIEKKFILPNDRREQILKNLNEFGAQFVSEDFEENILYSGNTLKEKNAVLRVRKTGGKTILTYKQRIEKNSDFKHQIEHETVVEKAGELEKILESLGFQKTLIYEKRRQTWKFREVEIMLDELPFDQYMEIEGSITAIAEAEMLLEIENLTVENETYPHLTRKFGVRKGSLIEARF